MPSRETVIHLTDADKELVTELKKAAKNIQSLEKRRVTIMKKMMAAGFRTREVAQYAGLDASTVSRYVRDVAGPSKKEEAEADGNAG